MPTLSIYIPPAKYAKMRNDEAGSGSDGAEGSTSEGAGWVSAASAHYVDVEGADWTLPEEAFPLRSAPPPAPPPHAPHAQHALHAAHHAAQHAAQHDDKDHATGRSGAGGVSPGGSSSPGSGSSGSGSNGTGASASTAPPNLDHNANSYHGMHMEEGELGPLSVREHEARPVLEPAPLLAAALRLHADLGDVQTAAAVMLVLHEYRSLTTLSPGSIGS
ncbi:hypothetical protein O3G_MSEX009742 [Manduca sexta]|uniref:Uncharacterized protein n=1 Tax=Manduca sexta TaxID=7130 RepID=A0A922CS96_MANSE|nr:hypothetical protein O3G_MSEX009742 [Manduca sexta]